MGCKQTNANQTNLNSVPQLNFKGNIMTTGIRAFSNAQFLKFLPQLAELGNAGFRRKVMESVVKKFEISVASAATHYNHSFVQAKIADPASVAGLGRAEDKKGGRPVQKPVTVVKIKSGTVVAEGISAAKAKQLIEAAAAKKGVAKLGILEVTSETATA